MESPVSVIEKSESVTTGGRAGAELARRERSQRIALLSPYGGGNFGDAAIQDSMIANLRARLPKASFSGISLSNENYLARHGDEAFPLCALSHSFWGMCKPEGQAASTAALANNQYPSFFSVAKSVLRRLPGMQRIAAALKPFYKKARTELQHWAGAYRFIRKHDLLVICGGGQLDDEWGGAWGHPYALFKWTLLSKMARVPCAMVSVGAGKIRSRMSRFFLSRALHVCSYRTYRDGKSKRIAASLFRKASEDTVIPDLALCLPDEDIPTPLDIVYRAKGRKIAAISFIAYARPGIWPTADEALFTRYMSEMASLVARLLEEDYFLVFVWSGSNDRALIDENLAMLSGDLRQRLASQTWVPVLEHWKDLVAILRSSDVLVASRLHSVLLGFVAQASVAAISFDPKVDWAMQDMGQEESLFQIHDFTATMVFDAVRSLESRREVVVREVSRQRQNALELSARQFDRLAETAVL